LEEQALATYRRVLGEDHPDTLSSMNNLAETRRDLGDLNGARELHEHALATRRRLLGDDHPDTQRMLAGLIRFGEVAGLLAFGAGHRFLPGHRPW
jgi:hypothetical protein